MDAAHSGFDVIGAVLFSIGLVALITALSEGELWGWLSAWVLALVAVAAITLSLWVRAELRVARPLVVLAQFRIRAVLGVNALAAVVSIAMYLFMPLVVEFVQIPRSSGYGFGASVAIAGLCLVPLSAGTALASPLAVWIRDRFGARVTITLAQLLFAGGILLFALRHAELWEAFVTMGIAGVAVGLSFSVMPGVIVAAVPADEVGAAMGLYQVIRWTGAAAGSAASATILAAYTATGHDLPSVMGYQLALIVASILCLLVIGLIFLIPPVSRVSHQASVATVAPTVGAPVRP